MSTHRVLGRLLGVSVLIMLLAALPAHQANGAGASAAPLVTLSGNVSPVVSASTAEAPTPQNQSVDLAVALRWQQPGSLQALVHDLYTPGSPRYHQFLSGDQFLAQYGPSADSIAAVSSYFAAYGLRVTGILGNVVTVHGTIGQAAAALRVAFHHYYHARSGRYFDAADHEPQVPATLAGQILGIAGLDTFTRWHTQVVRRPHSTTDSPSAVTSACSNPLNGLTPQRIATAYNLSSAGHTTAGNGQTIASFQLSTFNQSDINGYTNCFGLPQVTPTVVPVDGGTTDSSGADETTLDIELQLAMVPGISKMLVYEAPNTTIGALLNYAKIASDDQAASISTSWGLCEPQNPLIVEFIEYSLFQRMAAQGQSIYAAAGDSGAFDCSRPGLPSFQLAVDDPASQPYMVGVGGTRLSVGTGGVYQSETVWNDGLNSAGGGGASRIWPVPSYQQGVGLSTTHRNVPDVSLDADPNTGYAIFFNGSIGFNVFGGTSCAAPLWAGFTALVNQTRAGMGKSTLGFANPALYALGRSASYAADFHDVTSGNNLVFPATTGYDNATGWGTFNGDNLLNDLAAQ